MTVNFKGHEMPSDTVVRWLNGKLAEGLTWWTLEADDLCSGEWAGDVKGYH